MSKGIPVIWKRLISHNASRRPPFYDVFPQKKLVNKLLFELDSRLTFPKLYPLYESLYNTMDDVQGQVKVPTGITVSDIMVMKKVLEKLRHRTKSINKNLLALENEILNKAAEMGNNDAISLLAFDTLKDSSSNSHEDIAYAKTLIKELYQLRHPLTVKLTGDLTFKNNDLINAEKYYKDFLALEDDTFLAGEVYGQLGQISFRKPNLFKAEDYFLKSIKLCPLEYSVHSYFYLGQMYMNSQPLKARALLESTATQGFKESFKILGFLEMNYFEDYSKAQEWFKLGMELFEMECFVGYFDCCVKLEEWVNAKRCFNSMTTLLQSNANYEPVYSNFVTTRKDKLEKLEKYSTNVVMDSMHAVEAAKRQEVSKESRWNV